MDKLTTGFATIPRGQTKQVKAQMIEQFKEIVGNPNANVTVKLTPIANVVSNPEERLSFTHAYSVRIRA